MCTMYPQYSGQVREQRSLEKLEGRVPSGQVKGQPGAKGLLEMSAASLPFIYIYIFTFIALGCLKMTFVWGKSCSWLAIVSNDLWNVDFACAEFNCVFLQRLYEMKCKARHTLIKSQPLQQGLDEYQSMNGQVGCTEVVQLDQHDQLLYNQRVGIFAHSQHHSIFWWRVNLPSVRI